MMLQAHGGIWLQPARNLCGQSRLGSGGGQPVHTSVKMLAFGLFYRIFFAITVLLHLCIGVAEAKTGRPPGKIKDGIVSGGLRDY